MKYVVIDSTRGDIFTAEFNTEEEAIQSAKYQYAHKTDKERAESDLYVIESVNPDEEAENHLDGNVIYTATEEE